MYVGFLPTLWSGVLPHVFEAGASGPDSGGPVAMAALRRMGTFYDLVFPALVVAGLVLFRAAPLHARRVLASALLAGTAILALRYALPTALRDAKDVELLLPAVAVLSAAALCALWSRGPAGRAAAVVALALALGWSLARDAALYGERFLAVGR